MNSHQRRVRRRRLAHEAKSRESVNWLLKRLYAYGTEDLFEGLK